jgi:hypothetical protein
MQFWVMLGLTLIILSWLIQLLFILKKNYTINPWFIFFYSLGVIALVIDGFKVNNLEVAFLNIVTLAFAFIVLTISLLNKKAIKNKRK